MPSTLGGETSSCSGEYPPAEELLGLEPRQCRRAEFRRSHGHTPINLLTMPSTEGGETWSCSGVYPPAEELLGLELRERAYVNFMPSTVGGKMSSCSGEYPPAEELLGL